MGIFELLTRKLKAPARSPSVERAPDFTDRVVSERTAFQPIKPVDFQGPYGNYYICNFCNQAYKIQQKVVVREIERTANPVIFGATTKPLRFEVSNQASPPLYRCSNCLAENQDFDRLTYVKSSFLGYESE